MVYFHNKTNIIDIKKSYGAEGESLGLQKTDKYIVMPYAFKLDWLYMTLKDLPVSPEYEGFFLTRVIHGAS